MNFWDKARSVLQLLKAGACIFLVVFFFSHPVNSASNNITPLSRLLSGQDAAILACPDGKILYEKNADTPRIPASTLKILTSLVAFHYLGEDFRYVTEFFMDQNRNLTIKGYGDPLLISEEIEKIAHELKSKISEDSDNILNDIILDDTYFEKPLRIPGTVEGSLEPYDAPNGALCVNFNTVNFKTHGQIIVSAEPQTPLVALAREKIKASGLSSGRILLTNNSDEITRYAGQMFHSFLADQGITMSGNFRLGKKEDKTSKSLLIYRHVSPYPLPDVIARLMEYSNNFIANQLLLAAGAAAFGPPATMEKGVKAAQHFISENFEAAALSVVEGSGISRNNRCTARGFLDVLRKFRPWHRLMTCDDNACYKTGTLNGISTRAGFLVSESGGLYPFVVYVNTPGKSALPVVDAMKALIPAPVGLEER